MPLPDVMGLQPGIYNPDTGDRYLAAVGDQPSLVVSPGSPYYQEPVTAFPADMISQIDPRSITQWEKPAPPQPPDQLPLELVGGAGALGGTNMAYNGYTTGNGVVAQSTGLPILGGLSALGLAGLRKAILRAGVLTLGAMKQLYSRYGAQVLKMLVGAAAFKEFLDILDIGVPDETPIKIRRAPKRYSIGTNPRLNTLLKVGKRVDNIFLRYDKRISKFRSRLRGTATRSRRYYRPPGGYYLSPAEKKQLR